MKMIDQVVRAPAMDFNLDKDFTILHHTNNKCLLLPPLFSSVLTFYTTFRKFLTRKIDLSSKSSGSLCFCISSTGAYFPANDPVVWYSVFCAEKI
jgi:hypothetical protein